MQNINVEVLDGGFPEGVSRNNSSFACESNVGETIQKANEAWNQTEAMSDCGSSSRREKRRTLSDGSSNHLFRSNTSDSNTTNSDGQWAYMERMTEAALLDNNEEVHEGMLMSVQDHSYARKAEVITESSSSKERDIAGKMASAYALTRSSSGNQNHHILESSYEEPSTTNSNITNSDAQWIAEEEIIEETLADEDWAIARVSPIVTEVHETDSEISTSSLREPAMPSMSLVRNQTIDEPNPEEVLIRSSTQYSDSTNSDAQWANMEGIVEDSLFTDLNPMGRETPIADASVSESSTQDTSILTETALIQYRADENNGKNHANENEIDASHGTEKRNTQSTDRTNENSENMFEHILDETDDSDEQEDNENDNQFHSQSRSIVNFAHILKQLTDQFNSDLHGPFDCGIQHQQIINEIHHGFRTKWILQCQMCNIKSEIWSEMENKRHLDVNRCVVSGIHNIGKGHGASEEITANLGMQCSSDKYYKKLSTEIDDKYREILKDCITVNGIQEVSLVRQLGSMINGTPTCPVIVDG